MIQKPFVRALIAFVYITAVASLMRFGNKLFGTAEDSVMAPIAMLSLFVLSAAIMGFLFLARPLEIYFNGEKKEAIAFFLKTVTYFALLTILAFVALLLK